MSARLQALAVDRSVYPLWPLAAGFHIHIHPIMMMTPSKMICSSRGACRFNVQVRRACSRCLDTD